MILNSIQRHANKQLHVSCWFLEICSYLRYSHNALRLEDLYRLEVENTECVGKFKIKQQEKRISISLGIVKIFTEYIMKYGPQESFR